MKPYYSDECATIYYGDCREILIEISPVALVLTDPPYGIGSWSATGGNSLQQDEIETINRWDVRPDDALLAACVAKGVEAVVWGGNYVCGALGPWRSPLVWDKGIRGMHFADGEMAWTNFKHGSLRIFTMSAAKSDARGRRQHPTQKPVDLMQWCISLASSPSSLLDPFMGSGTTLIAAKNLGHKSIGIEIEERYCEIAAERLSQGVLDLTSVVEIAE